MRVARNPENNLPLQDLSILPNFEEVVEDPSDIKSPEKLLFFFFYPSRAIIGFKKKKKNLTYHWLNIIVK